MSAMALNIRRWRIAVASHDSYNPTHTTHGIGLCHYDIERLKLDVGEELWAGVRLEEVNIVSGNFRILCDGEHDDCKPKTLEEKAQSENVDAVSKPVPQELVTA